MSDSTLLLNSSSLKTQEFTLPQKEGNANNANFRKLPLTKPKWDLYWNFSAFCHSDAMAGLPYGSLYLNAIEQIDDNTYQTEILGPAQGWAKDSQIFNLDEFSMGVDRFQTDVIQIGSDHYIEQKGFGQSLNYSFQKNRLRNYHVQTEMTQEQLAQFIDTFGVEVNESVDVAKDYPELLSSIENAINGQDDWGQWQANLEDEIASSQNSILNAFENIRLKDTQNTYAKWKKAAFIPTHEWTYQVWLGQQLYNTNQTYNWNASLRFGMETSFLHFANSDFLFQDFLGGGVFFDYSPLRVQLKPKHSSEYSRTLDLKVMGSFDFFKGIDWKNQYRAESYFSRAELGIGLTYQIPNRQR